MANTQLSYEFIDAIYVSILHSDLPRVVSLAENNSSCKRRSITKNTVQINSSLDYKKNSNKNHVYLMQRYSF